MADLAITGRNDISLGNVRAVTGQVVIAADGDTVTPGLALILWFGITATTANAGQLVQASLSGGVATLKVEGGTPTINFIAIGV